MYVWLYSFIWKKLSPAKRNLQDKKTHHQPHTWLFPLNEILVYIPNPPFQKKSWKKIPTFTPPPPNSNITKKKSLSTNLGRCKGAFFSRHEDKVVISEALGGCFKHLSRWPALRGRIRHGWSKPTSAEPTARCEQSKVTQDFCVPWWEELQSPWQPVRVLLKFNKNYVWEEFL